MKHTFLVLLILFILVLAGCSNNIEQNQDTTIDKELQDIKKALSENPEENNMPEEIKTPIEEKNEKTETKVMPPEEIDKSKLQKLTVFETEEVALKLDAEDEDGDKITYAFSEPLSQLGKWKTNYGDAGEYVITITATDGKLTTTNNVLLIVKKKNEAPTIQKIPNIKITEGQTARVSPVVKDINNDDVTVTISGPLGNDGVWETDHTSAGEYRITVKATDGQLTSSEEFLVIVEDKNMAPEITNLQDITVKEGEKIVIKPIVNDLDKDAVKVTISEPVGETGVWQTSYKDHGEYSVTVRADDGKDATQKNVKIVVIDVNRPPTINNIELQ